MYTDFLSNRFYCNRLYVFNRVLCEDVFKDDCAFNISILRTSQRKVDILKQVVEYLGFSSISA